MNIIRERVIESSDDEDDAEACEPSECERTSEDEASANKKNKPMKVRKKTKRKTAVEVLIRRVPDDSQFIDIRIAVLGNVECGKSTLISVLTYDELDNGQGRARLNLLRHIHEIQTGHTSSISKEIIGFNDAAEV